MPAISRVGDEVLSVDGTGKDCAFPMKTACGASTGNTKVKSDGIFVVVKDDVVATHNKSKCVTDTSKVTSYSSKVFACGKNVARVGDQYTSSDTSNTITQGSSKVFAA